jgi:hypothetical protein
VPCYKASELELFRSLLEFHSFQFSEMRLNPESARKSVLLVADSLLPPSTFDFRYELSWVLDVG